MKWTEVIKDTAWVVEEVLTEEECQHFIQLAENAGIHEIHAAGDVRYRNSTTVIIDEEELTQTVYERIKDQLPQEVWVDENCVGLMQNKEQLYGKWTPCGLNTRWRVICYPGEGHIGPHRDSCHIEDEHHRSLMTFTGYLTDRPVGFGGATRFLKDDMEFVKDGEMFTTPDDAVLHRVEADKAGKAVVFFHDLMHDGEPLKEGSPPKWLFHFEVMYERDPETAPKITSEQKEARRLLKQAEAAESEGDISGAIKLYSRAYRLDPSLDDCVATW